MKIALPLFLIFLTVASFTQTPNQAVSQTAFSRVDRIGEASARSFFVFKAGDRNYAIRQDGHGEITAAKFLRWRNFDLRMGAAGRLERLYTAELSGDLLLAYEVTNGNSGWGYIARLDQEARAFRWTAPIASLNLGPGLIEDHYAYLTGQDFLAKLDLQTGKYVWQQTEFAKQYGSSFLEFGLPEITEGTVTFRERSSKERTIEVDKVTGRVSKVKGNTQ